MSRHIWRSIISLLIMAGLIIPSAIWTAPRPALAAPLAAAPAATASPAAARSLGRLLFAPAIDADGDPTTNPIAETPVPDCVQLLDQTSGLVVLAVQLQPLNPRERLLGTSVTWRVWHGDQIVLENTYRSDE